MAGVRKTVLGEMSEQWETFGPIACIFWLCWVVFSLFAIVALALGSFTFLAEAAIGLFVTTILFEVANVMSDRL